MTKKELARKTKAELAKLLGLNAKAVKAADGSLFDRLVYADRALKKDAKAVTKGDLLELASDALDALGDKFREGETHFVTPATAENSEKPASGKQASKPQDEGARETAAEGAKKVLAGKERKHSPLEGDVPDKKAFKKEARKGEKQVDMAPAFPETIKTDDGTYALARGVKTMDDLYAAVEGSAEIMVAYYWTKRHLKQFPYFGEWLGQPTAFRDDLDLCSLIYISDEKKVAYLVSMYTEAAYTLLPKDLEESDGMRFSGGIEYQIYAKED